MKISVPALSEKDAEDLRFALGLGVDMVALSFVRSPDDIKLVHQIMDEVGVRVPVIAKIEKPEAVEHLEAIVVAFDGIMVARGDLGVELPLEAVPLVQKRAVQLCRENARPVIVATQMLDSMIENSRPTRAEASDVANAVLDGTDALMLSGETSVGRFPVLTVRTMAKIITNVEHGDPSVPPLHHEPRTKGGAIAAAAKQIGEVLDAKALVAFTLTGDTVRRLSRHHTPAAADRLHAAAERAQPAHPVVGSRDVPVAVREAHRRHGASGRHASPRRRTSAAGRRGRHRRW